MPLAFMRGHFYAGFRIHFASALAAAAFLCGFPHSFRLGTRCGGVSMRVSALISPRHSLPRPAPHDESWVIGGNQP